VATATAKATAARPLPPCLPASLPSSPGALKGYFSDEFVQNFVKKSDAVRARSLPPLINRGYYARHMLIRSLLLHFLEFSKPSAGPSQVVILGCGFDTLYFQLRDAGEINADVLYVECDFPDVVEAKQSILGGSGLGAQERYSLVGADLRDVDGLMAKLQEAGIRRDAPTFFLAECVLVYMEVGHSNALLRRVSSEFPAAMAVVYEQVNPNDPFGRQMMFNLRARGCPLKGVLESLEAQRQRMTQCGWEDARSEDLLRLFNTCIPRAEIARINRLEMMDEEEEWNLLLQHYSITTARNGSLIPLFRDTL